MIRIGERGIGQQHAPFVTAEMSGNHNQSLERTLSIVDAAAKLGAHGLKIKTYTPDTMTLVGTEGQSGCKKGESDGVGADWMMGM